MRLRFSMFALKGAILAVMLAACHSPSYFGGGEEASTESRVKIDQPTLTKLKLVSEDGRSVLPLSPIFSPLTTLYEADIKMAEVGLYHVEAESAYPISYENGPEFMALAAGYVIVTVTNQTVKTNYLISLKNDALPYAKLESLEVSQGTFVESQFDPDVYTYQVMYPFGLEIVDASGTAHEDNPSARVVVSDVPLYLKRKSYMMVQVVAPGYNVGTYRINFTEMRAEPSFLEYLELSTGALNQLFDKDFTGPYEWTMPSTAQPVAYGWVRSGGKVSYNIGVARNGGVSIPNPKNGSMLEITAHGGLGYIAKTYQILIKTDNNAQYAKLASFDWTPADGTTLYKRDGGARAAGQAAIGFDQNTLNYELYMSGLPASFTFTATAATADTVVIMTHNGVSSDAGTFTPPFDWKEPLVIQVVPNSGSNPNLKSSVYQVFFNLPDDAKDPALLKDLRISGIVEKSLLPAFAPLSVYYTARVLRENSVLVRGIPEQSSYYVTYDPVDAIDRITENVTIRIKVDGGFYYRPVIYEVTLNVTDRQNPLFAELQVNRRAVELSPNQFTYVVKVPAAGAAVVVPFVWTLQAPPDVVEVKYSTDGITWALSTADIALDAQISVPPLMDKLVQIRVTCADGTRALYQIFLNRGAARDAELRLENIYVGETSPISLSWDNNVDKNMLRNFDPDELSYDVYITSGGFQHVAGLLPTELDFCQVLYSEDGFNWAESYKVKIEISEIKRVLVRVLNPDKNTSNDYAVSILRSTALYRVLSKTIQPVNAMAGKVDILSSATVTDIGVPAGVQVAVTLTPSPGYVIQRVTGPVGNTIGGLGVRTREALSEVPVSFNTIPGNGGSCNFYFEMPSEHVDITGYFEVLTSVDNRLDKLSVQSASGLAAMDEFNRDETFVDVAVVTSSATLKPEAPAGGRVYQMMLGNSNDWQAVAAGDSITVNGLEEDKTKTLMIQVRPDNESLGDMTYFVFITRLPQVKYFDVLSDTITLSELWSAPATGYYRFETWGASGGKNKNDTNDPDGTVGGKGGYSSGEMYVKKDQLFTAWVGSKGVDSKLDHDFNVHIERSRGGSNGGGYSSDVYSFGWGRGGGGGGGRTNFKAENGEIIMVAGGGSGAGSRTDGKINHDGGDGGGGNAGDSEGGYMNGDHSRTNGDGFSGASDDHNSFVGKGGGGGGYYGGPATSGGSGFVHTGLFRNISGSRGRGTGDGQGRASITWLGVTK